MGQINLGKVRGTMIYTGGYVTGSSASGTVFENTGIEKAYEGDLYINTDNSGDYAGCIYECIKPGNALEATWSYKGNIRGPKAATVNSLKSTSTEDALAAYQGNRLFEMMVDAGVFCKNVIVDYDQVAYGLKVRIDNVDSALIIVADGKEYEYTYTASGTAETTKVSIVLGENIGMPQSGGVVSEIRSDNAYIYTYEITGASAETVYSKNMDLWNSINEALLSHEVTGTVIDGEETLFMGPIHKFVNGIKKAFYPITHAKAVWFDKANKRTVHDEISELNKNSEKYAVFSPSSELALSGTWADYPLKLDYQGSDEYSVTQNGGIMHSGDGIYAVSGHVWVSEVDSGNMVQASLWGWDSTNGMTILSPIIFSVASTARYADIIIPRIYVNLTGKVLFLRVRNVGSATGKTSTDWNTRIYVEKI